jgi:predicted XRE-type DNA-binding protein
VPEILANEPASPGCAIDVRVSEVTETLLAEGLTQAAAAELVGVTQPRISDLVRDKIHRFSVDSLIEMLGHAGATVSFVVKPGRHVA